MISLGEWKAGGEFLQLEGHQIFVRQSSNVDAPALVLIHGFPSASWDWEGIWSALSEHYHLVTLDMLGFGLSDKPAESDYLIADQAKLFLACLARLNISSYHILAHDYGDTVAQELLARQLDDTSDPKIESACFLNGGLFPETHRPVLIQKLLLSPIGGLIAKLTSKKKFAANLHRIFGPETPPSSEVIDTLWELLNENDGVRIMHKLIHYMQQRRDNRSRWVGALANSRSPLCLIAGALDPISGHHMIQRYRELVPNAEVCELAHLGHYPQVESPNEISHAYLAFRKTLGY